MQLTSAKRVMAITLMSCFVVGYALAQDRRPSPVTPEVLKDRKPPSKTSSVLQEIEQLSPIGTATIVDSRTAITHAWFIDSSRGQVIVCSSIANLQLNCVKVGPPLIPHPAPPGIRYRGLGVSSVVANNVALTQAWYVDQFSMQVYVCEALSGLQNARCVQKPVPRD